MQQNKDRLAGFLPSKSYKAEKNLISAFPKEIEWAQQSKL